MYQNLDFSVGVSFLTESKLMLKGLSQLQSKISHSKVLML